MKRIVCFLMALIMVLGMIPNTAITANAYSAWSTTDTAINVMLNAKFYEKPTGGLLGYSTPASAEDQAKYASGISKEAAVTLLRKFVKDNIDKGINEYVKIKNIDLTLGQHNALAIHCFRNRGWENRNSGLMTAITSRNTGNDIVAAFMATRSYDVSNVESMKTTLDLSLCEAGLYLNGLYSLSGLSYAMLDESGDEKADKVIAYVSANGYNLDAGTSLGWYVFDGTVDGTVKGSPITKLTGDHNGKLIVKKTSAAAEYTINASKMINLNVYKDNKTDIKGTLMNNSDFKVGKEEMVGDIKWIYGTGVDTKGQAIKGWINMGAHDKVEENLKPIATAVLKSAQNLHDGATANSGPTTPAKTLPAGVSFNIYEIKTESTATGNQKWGKVIVDGVTGWINLAYATVEETLGESGTAIGKTGVVTGADEVNIRSSAAIIESPVTNRITALARGTQVTILEQNADGSWAKVKWTTPSNGYTQGWIYMHYVQMDNVPQVDTGAGSGSLGTVKYTGVVTSNINLNVRKYADIYAAKVDSLPHGAKINIYETTTSRNMKWGRIGENRWVCLTYVALTEVAQPESGSGSGSSTSTTVQATVKPSTLDVYKNYNANSQKVATLKKGDVVTILERNTENTSTGTRIWGRIKVGEVEGWINLAYAEVKTVTSVTGGNTGSTSGATSSSNGAAGTVANCISVNIREAAGVYNDQITKLNNGTAVKVYERVTKDGAPWARITWNNGANSGWVCMNYIEMNTLSGGTAADGTVGGTNSNTISATGIVNSNIDLKVRSGAGLGNAQIGSLKKGTKVTVYEQVSADGMIWGRTPYGEGSGWICMSYVTVESTSTTGKGVMGTVARCFAKVNVRSAPGTNNALVSTINVGSRVEVFETRQHGSMLWGRVAQGWVCMDYILLDSELPPGTVLDATVPTTEATKPGETTEPDDGLNLDGAISCSVSGTVGSAALDIFNDANADSTKVGSIGAGKAVTIVGVKKAGNDIWGVINQNGTQGWIKLAPGACSFKGYVNTHKQPIYDAPSTARKVGDMNIPEEAIMSKLGTDGTAVYGYIDVKLAWIPVSKLDATKPTVTTYYQNVGTGTLTAASTNGEVTAYKTASTSGDVAFKIAKDYTVGISAIDYINGKVWGKVIVDATTEGWIDMNGTTFALKVAPTAETNIFTTTDKEAFLYDSTDATLKITRPAGFVMTVRSLTFDANGNVWALIVQTDDVVNGNWVIIRNGDGTLNVNYA